MLTSCRLGQRSVRDLFSPSLFLPYASQSRSRAARNMPGCCWGSSRGLAEGLPSRAARVWSKALHVRTFPFKKGPPSLNSTATRSGYSSLLSQTRTRGNERNAQEGIPAGTTAAENRGAGPAGAGSKGSSASLRNYESLFRFT